MKTYLVIVLFFIILFQKLVISGVPCSDEKYCQFQKYPDFCSPLPIAILYTDGPTLFGKPASGTASYLSEYRYLSYLNIFGDGSKGGQSCMVSSDLTYSGYAGIRMRGRSTMYVSKSQFSVKLYGNATPEELTAAKGDWIYTTSDGNDHPRSSTCTNLNSHLFPNINCNQRKTKGECLAGVTKPHPCQWTPNTISGVPQTMPKKRDASLMGISSGNNWIFHAPGVYDHSMIRSFVAYNMARDSDEYASRTQFFELFIVAEYGRPSSLKSRVPSTAMHHTSTILKPDYRGVYLLAESPHAVGKGRLPVKKFNSNQGFKVDRGADGGYILSYDSSDEYAMPISSWRGSNMNVEYPDSDKITSSQFSYIQNALGKWETYFIQNPHVKDSSIHDSLNPSKLKWLRYRDFIDMRSWVMYILHMDISKNQDGYSLSFYMYKRENSNVDSCPTNGKGSCVDYPATSYLAPPLAKGSYGKWGAGPAWDYNLAYANSVGSDKIRNPTGWKLTGTFYWSKFIQDPLFVDEMVTQWTRLRHGKWSTENVLKRVNETAKILLGKVGVNSPMEREHNVHSSQSVGYFQDQIQVLRKWFHNRMSWIDEHICELYQRSYNPSTSGKDSMVPLHPNQKNSACTNCNANSKCVCGLCVDLRPTPAPIPTAMPTLNPTLRPTRSPTVRPTSTPTVGPTPPPTPKPPSHIAPTPIPVWGQLKINEVMSKNVHTIKDPSGTPADWVEIYNPGPHPEELSHYTLQLTTWHSKSFLLPHTILNPKQRKLIWCDGKTSKGPDHASFSITSSQSGTLTLIVSEKKYDEVKFGKLKKDTAWGRFPDGAKFLGLVQPTPGSPNLKLIASHDTVHNQENNSWTKNDWSVFLILVFSLVPLIYLLIKLFFACRKKYLHLLEDSENSNHFHLQQQISPKAHSSVNMDMPYEKIVAEL